MTFAVGDIVRRKGGTKALRVTNVSHWGLITLKYQDTGKYAEDRASNLVLFTGDTNMSSSVKYNYNDLVVSLLSKASDGRQVVEHENGTIETLAKDVVLKKIVPYTVEVREGGNGRALHYRCDEGAVKPGDILLRKSGGLVLYTVSKVATEASVGSKLASDFVKLSTTPITVEVL